MGRRCTAAAAAAALSTCRLACGVGRPPRCACASAQHRALCPAAAPTSPDPTIATLLGQALGLASDIRVPSEEQKAKMLAGKALTARGGGADHRGQRHAGDAHAPPRSLAGLPAGICRIPLTTLGGSLTHRPSLLQARAKIEVCTARRRYCRLSESLTDHSPSSPDNISLSFPPRNRQGQGRRHQHRQRRHCRCGRPRRQGQERQGAGGSSGWQGRRRQGRLRHRAARGRRSGAAGWQAPARLHAA